MSDKVGNQNVGFLMTRLIWFLYLMQKKFCFTTLSLVNGIIMTCNNTCTGKSATSSLKFEQKLRLCREIYMYLQKFRQVKSNLDPDQTTPRSDCSSMSSLIWVQTVCSSLSVLKLRSITIFFTAICPGGQYFDSSEGRCMDCEQESYKSEANRFGTCTACPDGFTTDVTSSAKKMSNLDCYIRKCSIFLL